MTLREFVDFLYRNNLIEISCIKDDTDDGCTNRLKIQKYVFLSKYFGLEFHYTFNMHLLGPYSKKLSQDYFELENFSNNPNALNSLNEGGFLRLLKDKSNGWLELAATILQDKGTVSDDVLLDHIAWGKSDFTSEEIEKVYNDLQMTILQ